MHICIVSSRARILDICARARKRFEKEVVSNLIFARALGSLIALRGGEYEANAGAHRAYYRGP